MKGEDSLNRYGSIIEKIFFSHYKPGLDQLTFSRGEMLPIAKKLGIELPKNLGDLIYTFRYRAPLPESIRRKAPPGKVWIIRPVGKAMYSFVATTSATILPSASMAETKVPDATPGIISMYALGDEQALLAKLRYNRLLDIFTGVTCYSLQNHLRTQVKGMGQIETDEIYVGLDKRGVHYAFPIQAKARKDKISVVQIEQDLAMCRARFPNLICRPVAAQFMADDLIALFELEEQNSKVVVTREKHYRLVESDQIQTRDLEAYRRRTLD